MNPFRFSEPVPPEELIDRDREARELLETATSGNNSRLVAPRRFGKTSLLRRVAADADREGWLTVYVDFFGTLTLDEVAERIERAYAEQLRGPFATWFSGLRRRLRPTIRAGGGPVPASAELSVEPQAEAPLLERLALPRRIHERDGTRTLVIFDEFQDVLAARDNADAVIRSEIQHHQDAASYIFAGSQVGMMSELFGSRRRAFYGQASPVTLEPLDPVDLAEHLTSRFERTGRRCGRDALDALLELSAGHPQRAMLLAHVLWNLTAPGREAGAATWGEAEAEVMNRLGEEFTETWDRLKVGQRRALAAIAGGEAPYGGRTGGSRGGAVRQAIQALLARGDLLRDERSPTGYRVTDPLLARWVRERRD